MNEWMKEGRKEKRKEGRKEGRKDLCNLPIARKFTRGDGKVKKIS